MEHAGLTRRKLDDWKALAAEEKAASLVSKFYDFDQVEKLEDSPDGLIRARFTISMGTMDRDHDTVDVNGWEIENFNKNPQVLWVHDYWGTPVPSPEGIGLTMLGLASELGFAGGAMQSVVDFQPRDLNPFAFTIAQLVIHPRRFVRASSVGFRPIAYVYNADNGGYDFSRQELMEWSICPIGCHPDALSEAKSAGIDLAPLKDWAEQALAGVAGAGLWVPKARLEAVCHIVSGQKSIAVPRLAFGETAEDEVKALLDSDSLALAAAEGDEAHRMAPAADDSDGISGNIIRAAFETLVAALKAGRVLSAANEARLRQADGFVDQAGGLIGEVLSQLDAQDGEGDKSAGAPASAVPFEAKLLAVLETLSAKIDALGASSGPSISIDIDEAALAAAAAEARRSADAPDGLIDVNELKSVLKELLAERDETRAAQLKEVEDAVTAVTGRVH